MMLRLFLLTALVAGLMKVASARSLKLKLTADDAEDRIPVHFEEDFTVTPESGDALTIHLADASYSGLGSFKIDGEWTQWEADNFTIYYATFYGVIDLQITNATTDIDGHIFADDFLNVYFNVSLFSTFIVPTNDFDAGTFVNQPIVLATTYGSPGEEYAGLLSTLFRFAPEIKDNFDKQFTPVFAAKLAVVFSASNGIDNRNKVDLKNSLIRTMRKN